MRKLLLYLAALLSFCPLFAQAETIPASGEAVKQWKADVAGATYHSDYFAAYQQACSLYGQGLREWATGWLGYDLANPTNIAVYAPWQFACANGAGHQGMRYPDITQYTCPAGQNWTLSGSNCTRPDCVSPATRNPSTGVCESPLCISTASASPANWYDMGTSPDAIKKFVCVGGCMALYSGDSVSKSAIVDGVRHYYAHGGYDFSGAGAVDVCTAGAEVPSVPSGTTEVPVSHCASNQIEGLIDGKLNCWNVPETPGAAPTLANPDAAATTTGTSTTTISTVGDTTTTTTTTNNIGGGTTIVTEACTAGNCTTTTAESGKDKTETTAGAGAATMGLYTADTGGKTFSGVLTSFKNTASASPIASAAGGFFQAGTFSGNCAALDVSFTMLGHAFALDATDVFCGTTALTWYGYIAAGLLLIATALAFWIAIL